MAAAISAHDAGIDDILIIERDYKPGGILKQCIHDGFGLQKFDQSLTGPEYADRYINQMKSRNIDCMLNTLVTGLTSEKTITAFNEEKGMCKINAAAVILAMGSRERPAGAITIAGERPAGIYTAGLVQNLINMKNIMVGEKAVILGSGDIGLIMARRLALEGVEVQGVLEIMPYTSGLPRNINQCLKDFDIPLKLNHTAVEVLGKSRVEGVISAKVDDDLNPIPSTRKKMDCDTLLLSVGLIPENELSRQAGIHLDNLTGGPLVKENLETNISGIFAAGNVLHIHDIVDYVSTEAARAGRSAAKYLKDNPDGHKDYVFVEPGEGIDYVIPQLIKACEETELFFRTEKPFTRAAISIKNRKEIINEKSFPALHPSRMEKVKINKDENSNKKILKNTETVQVFVNE